MQTEASLSGTHTAGCSVSCVCLRTHGDGFPAGGGAVGGGGGGGGGREAVTLMSSDSSLPLTATYVPSSVMKIALINFWLVRTN